MKYPNTIIFLFFHFTSLTSLISARNYLSRGSYLSAKYASSSDNYLTSPDNTFTCGFYSTGTNAYWFSIWFTNANDRTVVWTANRDRPVNRRGSRLTLRNNGVLLLTDLDGSTAWESNTTGSNVDRAELLNTGNLVLKDNIGNILWQSFDYPTDTLLPHQVFTKNQRLVSRIGPNMFGSGYFSFFFDTDNVLRMIYDGPEISSIYWPNIGISVFQNGRTNYNSSRIAFLDDMGTFHSSDLLQFSASDVGIGIKRRLTMDFDGNLRLYSLNDSSRLWNITWQAVVKLCDVHGLCGRNGICAYMPEPKCSCPPYYEPTDSSDSSKGCRPRFQRSCSDSEFVELTHVDYYGFDLNYSGTTSSFNHCRDLCLGDCRCQAFSYRLTGQGMCFTKGALFNGFRSNDFPGTIYVRVPGNSTQTLTSGNEITVSRFNCGNGQGRTVLLSNTYDITNQRFRWVYLYTFEIVIGSLEVVLFVAGWWFLFRKQDLSTQMEDGYQALSNQFRSFSYGELKSATRKFKEVVGRGGFGTVYKGVLEDEREVAVKKLGDVVQGEEEFWAEVSTIGKINHMNLARMWGFCSQGKHRLLVYEYVENVSLDKYLFSTSTKTVLGWKERFKVALGTARGLAYLHHECLEWVIHCDVKPENILLDSDFEPKISDFGLAKLCQRGGNGSSEMTKIRGTKGYMAPEWAMNLPITAKVDVYSFGVVILELVKGIRLSSLVVDDPNHEEIPELVKFVRLAKRKIQNGEKSWVEDLVDPRLYGNFDRNQAAIMVEVGLSCVEDDRNKRPTMESVAQVLAECEETLTHMSG